MRTPSSPPMQRQRGATLIVAMVLLMALTLLGVWGYNSSTGNMRIVGNMQVRQEATDAAQAAIETTISSPLFTTHPDAVAAAPVEISINGTTYPVMLKDKDGNRRPTCYRVKVIKQMELDGDSPADTNCMWGTARETGIESEVPPAVVTTGDSMCSNTEWNVYAEVTDQQTGAFVSVNQGISARVLTTDANNACPTP